MTRTELPNGCYSVTNDWGTYYYNSAGQRHRDGGLPAIEYADGSKAYYVNGHLHRDGGLPAVERADGSKAYYVNGQRHRDGGLPAYEGADGSKHYFVNGQQHNARGPAAISARGAREYWLEDRRVLKAEWESHPDVIAAKKSGDSANELPSESA